MNVPKLNETLIGKVLTHIKTFPASYDQDDVASTCNITKGTPCGAIGCFGGWAVLLSYPKAKRAAIADSVRLDKAQELVGFTDGEADFVFDATGTGDSKKDYKTIVSRLKEVRRARKLVAPLAKLPKETLELINNTEIIIDVEDNNGHSAELRYY